MSNKPSPRFKNNRFRTSRRQTNFYINYIKDIGTSATARYTSKISTQQRGNNIVNRKFIKFIVKTLDLTAKKGYIIYAMVSTQSL